MLKLYRIHEKIVEDDYEEYYEEVLRWDIGTFKSFKCVEKYLCDYHNYKEFKTEEYRKIIITIGNCGHCYIPVYSDERTMDDCLVHFYIEKV